MNNTSIEFEASGDVYVIDIYDDKRYTLSWSARSGAYGFPIGKKIECPDFYLPLLVSRYEELVSDGRIDPLVITRELIYEIKLNLTLREIKR